MGNRSLAHCASMTGESPGGNVHARAWQLAIVVAVAMGSATRAAQPDARQMGGIGITVFEDSNYRGRNATFRDDEPDLRRAGLNDRIQSLQVAPGEMWEVCEHDNFRGRCQVFSGVEPDLRPRGWSRMISSMRRVRGGGYPRPPVYPPTYPEPIEPGGLTLYSNRNFGGSSRTLNGPTPDLRRMDFSDRAESLRLPRGQVWEVCKDIQYRDCVQVSSDYPDLRRLGNLSGEISSARPWRSGGGFPGPGPGPVPPFPGPGVRGRLVIYSGINFTGRATVVSTQSSAINLRSAGSVRVEGGNWQICEDTNFRGRCSTVNVDVPDIRSFGLPGRVRSARPIAPPQYDE
jgi:hypothetical protein